MNDRVKKLRAQSVDTPPFISSERAQLVTRFYTGDIPNKVSAPVCRAMCFKYIMTHKQICINDGELIVGERGPAPKATPTFPELCCHTIEDLKTLNTRDKTTYLVSDDVLETYEQEIIPFWKGNTIREKVFDAMNEDWKNAFDAGIFTEFMEQRTPGHSIADEKIFHTGMLDFKKQIAASIEALDFEADPFAKNKEQELIAMDICADSIILLAQRYAKRLENLANQETDEKRRAELFEMARICNRVPANTPETFHEALQHYWFIHLGVITEINVWDSYNPGRLDLNLMPFYKAGIATKQLSKESAEELLQCFWVKFNNHTAPPKVGVTEEQSSTHTDFALINVGGVDPHNGLDSVNDLSYLILDVVEEMKLTQPSACIQLSKKNPDRFLHRACRVIRCGFGQPSVFNTDTIINEMLHAGKTMADARQGGPSGCVTISAFGKECCTLTGYYNWPKVFELVLTNGFDKRTQKQLGPKTGDPAEFQTFEDLYKAFETQLKYFIDLKIQGNDRIEELYQKRLPTPFMSVLVDDCIKRGLDYHNGGPRYSPNYIQGVGIGTLTDCLSAMKLHVYENKDITMTEMIEAIDSDFDNNEFLRQKILKQTPFYGNDDEYADSITQRIFNSYYDMLNGRPNKKGGFYRVNLLPTTSHIYFGSVIGALPNGRKATLPLSDGISPGQGYDRNGPTAVLKSAARIDHARTGGTLLNMKFSKNVFDGDNLYKLAHLIRAYFKMDGHHIQFNIIDAETLKKAKKNPEQYRNLIIRVAGYSDYFVGLSEGLQDEIIARTEQYI